MLHIIYFAQLKDDVDCSEETLAWQPHLTTINDLKITLSQRNPQWQRAFSKHILSAVNQAMTNDDHPINKGDEIAFFPPVTGG